MKKFDKQFIARLRILPSMVPSSPRDNSDGGASSVRPRPSNRPQFTRLPGHTNQPPRLLPNTPSSEGLTARRPYPSSIEDLYTPTPLSVSKPSWMA